MQPTAFSRPALPSSSTTSEPPHLPTSSCRSPQAFDALVSTTFLKLLNPTSPGYSCSLDRYQRAQLRASLPTPIGCGLYPSSDTTAIAWWASVQASLDDPLLFSTKEGLKRFAQPAWRALTESLGTGNSPYFQAVSHLLPPNADGLLDGSLFYPGAFLRKKVNKPILQQISKKNIDYYSTQTSCTLISPSFSQADYVIASSRTFSGKIFSEPFQRRSNQLFSSDNYIAFCRFHLGLPPPITLSNAAPHPICDYPLQQCLQHPSAHLDAAACHANACSSAFAARTRKHNNIARVFATAALEAGLEVSREPDTYSLLLSEFSKTDCARIFPRKCSKSYKEAFETLTRVSLSLRDPSCTLTTEQKALILQHHVDALPLLKKKDTSGLRIDLALVNPLTSETRWIDVTSVNTAGPSVISQELSHLLAKQSSALFTSNTFASTKPSPVLDDRESLKAEKYARLITVANRQTAEGKRLCKPIFSPCAVSTTGELGAGANLLQEWIVNQYHAKCKRSAHRSDGLTVNELVRTFRHKFKLNLQFVIAVGMGNLILQAGLACGAL